MEGRPTSFGPDNQPLVIRASLRAQQMKKIFVKIGWVLKVTGKRRTFGEEMLVEEVKWPLRLPNLFRVNSIVFEGHFRGPSSKFYISKMR